MIASGKTATEITRELFLSIKTVSTYRSRILKKMGMKNNVELARYAEKHNLAI
jgi:DNA-binding NarL/FixJ family response regulator